MAALLSSPPARHRRQASAAPLRLYTPAPGGDRGSSEHSREASGERRATRGAGALQLLEGYEFAPLRAPQSWQPLSEKPPARTAPARIRQGSGEVLRERPLPRPAASPQPSAPARRRPARRGGALPALATVGLLVGLWFGAGALRGATPRPAVLSGSRAVAGGYLYRVRPGDTLWSIASRLEPNADPRPLVDELAAQVPAGTLVVGETLHLP